MACIGQRNSEVTLVDAALCLFLSHYLSDSIHFDLATQPIWFAPLPPSIGLVHISPTFYYLPSSMHFAKATRVLLKPFLSPIFGINHVFITIIWRANTISACLLHDFFFFILPIFFLFMCVCV